MTTSTTEKVTKDSVATAQQVTDRATEQIREIGERATGSTKAFGQLALDTYEQAVASFVELEHKAAEATPVDWVKAAISAHASFVEDLNAAYVRAARSVLD